MNQSIFITCYLYQIITMLPDIGSHILASIFLVELKTGFPARGKVETYGMAINILVKPSQPISLVPFDLERRAIRQIERTVMAEQVHFI